MSDDKFQRVNEGVEARDVLPCLHGAVVYVSVEMSLYIFMMNIFGFGGLGTMASSFFDNRGFNFLALVVGFMQVSLVMSGMFARQYYDPGQGLRFIPYAMVIMGWSWGIVHGKKLMEWTYDCYEDGQIVDKEVVKIKDQKDLVIDKSHFLGSAKMGDEYPVTKV